MGKTTLIKKKFLRTQKNKMVYALMSDDFLDVPKIKVVRNFKQFVSEAINHKDTIHIVDEAKSAIPRNEPEANKNEFEDNLIKWFLNARKYNNFIILIYHSLRDIPVWLLMYTKFLLRFNTLDQLDRQTMRFNSYPNIISSIKENPTIKKFEYDEIKVR